MKKTAALLLLALLTACSSEPKQISSERQASSAGFPVQPLKISSAEEGWGADLRLSIVNKSENDSAEIYTVVSSYEGKELGFLLTMKKTKEGKKGFGNGITLKSTGVTSDNLLRTLSKLYKQKEDTSLKFVSSVTVNYANLNELAKELGGQKEEAYVVASEYKLFFEGKAGEDYAELFLNINENEHWVELMEKDEEYRPSIIKFLKK
jgi:hypothetical protein